MVQKAINGLSLHDGQDPPEDYATAVCSSRFDSWRPGAKHIVILFGDAPAHDPTFYVSRKVGGNYGVDSGPDGAIGAKDDLTLSQGVQQVKASGIQVDPVNSDVSGSVDVKAGFDYLAQQTGGQTYPRPNADQLANLVASSLKASTSKINKLTLQATSKYASWVTTKQSQFINVGGNETKTFDVTITVPEGTSPGGPTFALTVLGDGATLGSTAVRINVLPDKPSINAQSTLDDKRALINNLSNRSFETEFLSGKLTLPPLDNYGSEEKQVAAWLDTLGPVGSLTPAQPGALYRLKV